MHTKCFDPSPGILSELLQNIYGLPLSGAPHQLFPQRSCRALTCDMKESDLFWPGIDPDVPQVKTLCSRIISH